MHTAATIAGVISIRKNIPAAIKAVAGMVTTHAIIISLATPQRTLLSRSADPTPMIDELTTCVVLTGPPIREAPNITMADVIWALNACTGRIL